MTISQMLGQSGLLTLLGLCVVFGFLIIMILCMKLLHVILHALKLDKDKSEKNTVSSAAPAASATSSAAASPAADNGAVIAAIACAINEKEAQ